jgi:hypothetical protein
MKCLEKKIPGGQRVLEYANTADFQDVFTRNMSQLFLVALLLVGDELKAERCLIGGVDDCVKGNPVFKEWAQSWSKRLIVRRAIQMSLPILRGFKDEDLTSPQVEIPSTVDPGLAGILQLPQFERFVYVLSVLEKYSDRECSLLLICTPQQVITARIRALQRIVGSNNPSSARLFPQLYKPEARDVVAREEISHMQIAVRND